MDGGRLIEMRQTAAARAAFEDCDNHTVNWRERSLKSKSLIERLQYLAEHVVLSYDNNDQMANFTLQEKYLAKEFLRIMEEEESK